MGNMVLKNINKIYPNGVQAVFDFNLEIKDKEFVRRVYRDVERIAQISGDEDTINLMEDLFDDILTH